MLQPKITLVDWPRYPIETVTYLWDAARNNDPILHRPEEIAFLRTKDAKYDAYVRELFEKVIDSAIPISENLNFTFLLEGVSISFREQMVRHRIGVKVGDRLGADMFPDIHDSTWWVQSMRVLDMSKFAERCEFRLPESIITNKNPEVRENYIDFMHEIADMYKYFIDNGVPVEDAREVIPLGAQHRLSWTLNLSSLTHILKKRSCWIPQIGTWGPVIEGMVNELATRVDPYFRKLVTPPCIKKEKFTGCIYKLDNERRVDRSDPLPPCPLYLNNEAGGPPTVSKARLDFAEPYKVLENSFGKLWGRDTQTGELLQK